MMEEHLIRRAAAETFCKIRGIDPNYLEPGDIHGVDATLSNGEPAHFVWREFANHPEVISLAGWLMQAIGPKKVSSQELNAIVLKPIKLNPFHADVLKHLFDDDLNESYALLSSIAIHLNSNKNRVRLVCRALTRKGLAKRVSFHDDEGYIRGSGYGITEAGVEYAKAQGWKVGE